MQNLEQLLESFIAEALQDEQETIPTLELPSAAIIAERIIELEDALQEILYVHANDAVRPNAFYVAQKALNAVK